MMGNVPQVWAIRFLRSRGHTRAASDPDRVWYKQIKSRDAALIKKAAGR